MVANTHTTTIPPPNLITLYLENALINLSFFFFSAVPIFELLFSVQHLPLLQTSQTLLLPSPAPATCCFTSCSTYSTAPAATRSMGRKFTKFCFCNTSESSHLPVAWSQSILLLRLCPFTILQCPQGLLHIAWVLYSALCWELMVLSNGKLTWKMEFVRFLEQQTGIA